MTRTLVLLLGLLVAVASPASPPGKGVFGGASSHAKPAAQVEPPLRILAVEEPPASYIDDQGNPAGFAVDVVRELQRRLGNTDPVSVEPESRVYESGLMSPNVLLLSFSRTPERDEHFHMIARVIHKPWVFYGRGDAKHRLASLDDVRKLKSVGVVTGDVRARWLQEQGLANLQLAQDHEQVFRLLQAKRVDAVFSEPQGLAWFCRRQDCSKAMPKALWSPRWSDVYIMMSRQGTSLATVKRWQDAAAAMSADGILELYARRWMERGSKEFGIRSTWRDGMLEFCLDNTPC